MEIGVRAIPYNRVMRAARKRKGLTQEQLGELLGVSQQTIGKIECFRRKVGQGKAQLIALELGVEVDDLFPPECRDLRLGTVDFVCEVKSLDRLSEDIASTSVIDDLEERIDRELLQEKLWETFNKRLYPREKMVLTMRLGLDGEGGKTFEEVGAHFGVSRERIRQIEAKALRKLRHPLSSKPLRALL